MSEHIFLGCTTPEQDAKLLESIQVCEATMTSEDLLNQVLQSCERDGYISDSNLKRRIEMHLSGMANDSVDAELRDFDERQLQGIPVRHGENPEDIDIHMSRSSCDKKRRSEAEQTASLRFVGNGTEFELIAFPHESLRKIAKFILETVDSYDEWQL